MSLLASSKTVGLVAGLVLALAMVALAESDCKLHGHEPITEPQLIQFPGGNVTFQASLRVYLDYGNKGGYVALESTGQASYDPDSSRGHPIVTADFDCAKLAFSLYRWGQVVDLHTSINYNATIPGGVCMTKGIPLDANLQVQSLTEDYIRADCSMDGHGDWAGIAIRNIRFQFDKPIY